MKARPLHSSPVIDASARVLSINSETSRHTSKKKQCSTARLTEWQTDHFTRYAPEHIEVNHLFLTVCVEATHEHKKKKKSTDTLVFLRQKYGVNRYQTETRRLYSVLDKHLASENRQYLCGTKCTIAGKSCVPVLHISVSPRSTINMVLPCSLSMHNEIVSRLHVTCRSIPLVRKKKEQKSKTGALHTLCGCGSVADAWKATSEWF